MSQAPWTGRHWKIATIVDAMYQQVQIARTEYATSLNLVVSKILISESKNEYKSFHPYRRLTE